MPAIMTYLESVTKVAARKKSISDSLSLNAEVALIDKLSTAYEKLDALNENLINDRKKAEAIEDSLEMAKFYQETILKDMSEIREVADAIETVLPEDVLPYPSYAKMLFYV